MISITIDFDEDSIVNIFRLIQKFAVDKYYFCGNIDEVLECVILTMEGTVDKIIEHAKICLLNVTQVNATIDEQIDDFFDNFLNDDASYVCDMFATAIVDKILKKR